MSDIDWNREPYVTGIQFMEMKAHERQWFLNQPNIWRPAIDRDVLMNTAHPDNREWASRDLIAQATSAA